MWNLSILKMPPKKKHYIKVKPKKKPVKIFIGGPRVKKPFLDFSFLKPKIAIPAITLPGQDVFPDEAGPAPQIVEPGQDIVKAVPEGPVEAVKEKVKGFCEKLGVPCWAVGVGGLTALWIIFK